MDFSVHRYRSSCGRLDLAARIYPAKGLPPGQDAPPGPDLLLMHGLTRNAADFEPLIPHLARRYRLIVPDQRGRGLSQWDDVPANYRPDIYCADMFALLDGLGIASVTAIGTSMGGLIAMGMNAMRPDMVWAVVLNDVGPVLDPAGLARIQGYVGSSAPMQSWDEAAERCRAINCTAFPDFTTADWLAFAHRTCTRQADGTIAFAYDPAVSHSIGDAQPAAALPDLWPLWQALGAKPVLVIRGELSDLLSAETVETMAAHHPGYFAAVEVPRVGHAPLLNEPDALAAITRFLAEHA